MSDSSFYFDPEATGTGVFLGPTEAKLMDIAWEKKQLTVKQALFYLGAKERRAYTTIMTVLGNLAQKGMLERSKDGRVFVYSPAMNKSEFLNDRQQIIKSCLQRNFTGDRVK